MKNEIDIKTDLHLSALAMGYRNISKNTMKKPVGNTCFIIDLNRYSFGCYFYITTGEVMCWSCKTFEQNPEGGYVDSIRHMEMIHGIVKCGTHDGKGFDFLTQEQQWEFIMS